MANPTKPPLDDLRIESKSKPEPSSRVWLLAITVVLFAIFAGAAWQFLRPKAIPVRTVIASAVTGPGVERTVLNASGYVTARREATVSSKVTGKVTEVLIEEGMKVKDGQVLARLDDTNVKASLQLAEAQLASARAALAETKVRIREAELNLRRIADLAKHSISAQAELDHAEAEVNSLKAKLEQQQSDVIVVERMLPTWQQQLEDTVIRARCASIVTSKNA